MNWVRARSEEQIEQRISEIVKATARLYENHRFEEITFAMIAKEANFTRSNLYRYFDTKEEIFLELLKHDVATWRNGILDSFTSRNVSIQDFSETWVNLLLKHKRMIKLFTILYTLLEPNVSLVALTTFKQEIMKELGLLAEFLTRIMPFPSEVVAAEFLYAQSSLAIGFYPMIDLTPKQKEAMESVGMETSPEYFETMLSHSTELLLKGLLESNR